MLKIYLYIILQQQSATAFSLVEGIELNSDGIAVINTIPAFEMRSVIFH